MNTPDFAQPGAPWKFEALKQLRVPNAPRVFTAAQWQQWLGRIRPELSELSARAFASDLTHGKALHKISQGLYQNLLVQPAVHPMEAAVHLRAGAVISLHSVLGECGFLNNPSAMVTAVLPTSPSKRPSLGEVHTSGGYRYRFHGLAEKFFPTNDEEQWMFMQPSRACQVFRPEAAFLHWLHLAGMQRSRMTAPPVDVDMDMLDDELLKRLAIHWELEPQLAQWTQHALGRGYGQEDTSESPSW